MIKKFINSVLNYEVLVSALIGAIGYGFGFAIANYFGLSMVLCIVVSFGLGSLFDYIATKLITLDTIQKSKNNKVILTIVIYVIYVLVWVMVHTLFDYDLDYDLLSDLGFVLLFQFISLVVHFIKKLIM